MIIAIIINMNIMLSVLLLFVGITNITKKPGKNEKVSVGEVEEFKLLTDEKNVVPLRYVTIIQVGSKKYTITSYHTPWLKKGEEVKIQITGKQKVLGNNRLNSRGKVEIVLGIMFVLINLYLFLM